MSVNELATIERLAFGVNCAIPRGYIFATEYIRMCSYRIDGWYELALWYVQLFRVLKA
jgi:hypothetical protein